MYRNTTDAGRGRLPAACALERMLASEPRTQGLDGAATSAEVGKAIAEAV